MKKGYSRGLSFGKRDRRGLTRLWAAITFGSVDGRAGFVIAVVEKGRSGWREGWWMRERW